MRVVLLCIGRQKLGPERDLVARYIERAAAAGRQIGIAVEIRELEESRARRPDDRKAEEAKAMLAEAGASPLIAFDEVGAAIDSLGFAALIGKARDDGEPALTLVIGGPDGFDPAIRHRATKVIAFGMMTWPHQLARIMTAEQIYRTVTILNGHPYHRP